MSVDATLVQQSEAGPLSEEFTVLVTQMLGPSRSYVIQAMGEVFGIQSETTVRLEAGGFDIHETRITIGSSPPEDQGGCASFTLATAFTAPDEEGFVAVARVLAFRKGGLSIVGRVRLLVLTVDSVTAV